MRKTGLILMLLLLCTFPVYSQIGIGAAGGFQYPGFLESERLNIRFSAGPGYGFFVRHDLIQLADKYEFHARYNVKFFFNATDLPGSGNSTYKFNEFSADIWTELYGRERWNIYSGISINLLNVTGAQRYRNDYTGTAIVPKLITGYEYILTESYNVFAELFMQIAEIDAGPEPLPITGMGMVIGITMFISE